MSWRVLAASEIGTSHIETGRTCEDSCWAQVLQTKEGEPFLVIFVADGAGSASHGGEGAEIAMSAAASFIEKKLKHPEIALADELAVGIVTAVRAAIDSKASADGLKARDFSCTFLGLVSMHRGTLLFQVGDGGIAVDFGDGQGLQVPIAPMGGEYANMTSFVTGEDAIAVLQCECFDKPVQQAALFSDGLQRLALNMASNTAHVPFFTPFFSVLSKSTEAQDDQLAAALQRFLASPAVNERTDDDKTLAIATLLFDALLKEPAGSGVGAEQPAAAQEAEQQAVAPAAEPMRSSEGPAGEEPGLAVGGDPGSSAAASDRGLQARQACAAAVYAEGQKG